jgi:bifunctional DNA-binding transcriptional regulator/antitoxin component of YhaV-PrlF toxin-antitoxin module
MAVTVKNKRPIVVPDAVRRKAGLRTRSASDFVMQIIEEAKKNPMTAKELAAEKSRLMAYGARQAQRAGIKERDIPRVIHDSRSRRRAS